MMKDWERDGRLWIVAMNKIFFNSSWNCELWEAFFMAGNRSSAINVNVNLFLMKLQSGSCRPNLIDSVMYLESLSEELLSYWVETFMKNNDLNTVLL